MYLKYDEFARAVIAVLAAIILAILFSGIVKLRTETANTGQVFGIFTGPTQLTQFYPYGEWEISDVEYTGNPYDLVATATFTGTSGDATGQVRTVDMFYDGDTGTSLGKWKFRFNGDLTGDWTISTTSGTVQDVNSDLDGWSGSVTVTTNPNNVLRRGFVQAHSAFGNKWSRSGLDTGAGADPVFSPTFVMGASPSEYYSTPGKLDGDLNLFLYDHNQIAENQANYGFDGFNLAVYCRWFDIDAVDGECDTTTANTFNNNDKRNPDRRTFAALEEIISETYQRGGVTHLWLWGDTSRDQNLNDGSYGEGLIGSSTAERLYEYIVARLGAVPGWTMGFGNGLDDWAFNPEIEYWYNEMDNESVWPHLLSAQGKYNPNSTTTGDSNAFKIDGNLNDNIQRILPLDDTAANDDDSTTFNRTVGLISNQLNTYSWADSQPSLHFLHNLIESIPPDGGVAQPHFSEQRFIVGDYTAESGYTYLMASRGQIYNFIAGGVASIWGNAGSPYDSDIIDGTATSLEFDSTNHYSGSVNNVDSARQHPNAGADTSAYDAQQHFLNRAIAANRYLRADMTDCTDSVIRDISGIGDLIVGDGSGVCLESPDTGDELILVYEEEVGTGSVNTDIQLDLQTGGYTDITNARAIDLRANSYSETDITGSLAIGATESWTPPTNSDWLLILNMDDGLAAPDAITDLDSTAQSQAVLLNWTAPADNGALIDYYEIEYREQGAGVWSGPYSTGSSSNTFIAADSDSNYTLTTGTTYEFRVYAINSEGTSAASNPVTETIVEIPDQVGTITATSLENSVQLDWSAPSANGSTITDYVIEYKISTDPTFTIFADGVSATTSATVTGLSFGTTYTFRVAAKNAVGTGNYSGTTTGQPASAPEAIADLDGTGDEGEVDLTWSAPTDNNSSITDYVVEYRVSGSGSYTTFNDGTSTNTFATVTGLSNGVDYDFRVIAVNAIGQGPSSNIFTGMPLGVAAAVDDLGGTVSDQQVVLSWTAPNNGGYAITDYIVEYELVSSPGYSVFADGTSTTTSATITGLTNDEAYNFRVAVVNSAGTSSYSNIANLTPSGEIGAGYPRQGVYRLFNLERGVHFYTPSTSERDKVADFPAFALENNGDAVYEALTKGSEAPGATPVYRLFNIERGVHFYTASESEKDKVAGFPAFNLEGESFRVYPDPAPGLRPVYRLFALDRGTHLYTTSTSERDKLAALDTFAYETIAYYVFE